MKYICGNTTPVLNRAGKSIAPARVLYVSQLRGDGGVDWGYTEKRDEALPMSERMAKIYINEGPQRRFMQCSTT